ncbi:hypothetical protein Pvag_pPag30123 (plasmid) [Pantoea vagans C9-1]|nr:hypothetical protein Pvag_pPag30123 [Pantoea vagans C9-1]
MLAETEAFPAAVSEVPSPVALRKAVRLQYQKY